MPTIKISNIYKSIVFISILTMCIAPHISSRQNTVHNLYIAGFILQSMLILPRKKKANNIDIVAYMAIVSLTIIYIVHIVLHYHKVSIPHTISYMRIYIVLMQYPMYILIANKLNTEELKSIQQYVLMGTIVTVLLWLPGVIQKRWSPYNTIASQLHNSYFALACLYIGIEAYDKAMNHSTNYRALLMAICIIMFSLPFFGYLRASSLTALIIAGILILNRRNSKNIILIVIISIIYILVYSGPVTELYRQNRYNYNTPIELLQDATNINEPNAAWRTETWAQYAYPVIRNSPIYGGIFSVNVDPTGRGVTGSSMLHSFWVSIALDGGLILLSLYATLIILPILKWILNKQTRIENTKSATFIILIIGTISTNTWGYAPLHTVLISIMLSVAVRKIYG